MFNSFIVEFLCSGLTVLWNYFIVVLFPSIVFKWINGYIEITSLTNSMLIVKKRYNMFYTKSGNIKNTHIIQTSCSAQTALAIKSGQKL